VEALAALDALRELLSDAKSGDLAYRGDTVAPQTVREWLKGHLPAALCDFVDKVLATQTTDARAKTSDAHEIEALNELLAQTPMLPLEEAAQALQLPVEQLAVTVRKHSEHFGLLGQPPTMLFRAVDRATSEE
jgi:hypothetical protein